MTLFHRMKLNELLVCPVCHGELPLEEIRRNSKGNCHSCGRTFTCNNGVFDLTPVPPPDSDVLEKWALWEKLQVNGALAYRNIPEASCSIRGRSDVKALKYFLKLRRGSLVLDIGCGPIGVPEYLRGWSSINIIGLDPLQPEIAPSKIAYIKGIGEYLPLRDSSCDSIILAGSLDHALSPHRVMTEVKRCLKTKGTVLIWAWSSTQAPPTNIHKPNPLIEYIKNLMYSIKPPRPPEPSKPPAWQKFNETLKVPPGAIDPYHFRHDDENELLDWCAELGFIVSRRYVHASNNLFFELQHNLQTDKVLSTMEK